MINFELKNIPDMIFGRGTEERCGELLKSFGGTKALIHHSGEPFVQPLIEKVKGYLTEAGMEYAELGGVVPNPRLSKVYEGIELCRKEKCDCVLAVGGGSVIDSAKGIACGVPYGGDVWDMYRMVVTPKKVLTLGVISTFSGTGSECSCASVVTNEKTQLKLSIDDNPLVRPAFCILNPELTYSVPPMQTASGASDIMSHLVENFCTATPDVYMNHQFLIAGMKTVLKNAPIAVREPDNYAARSALAATAPFAISGLLRIGLVGDWACHLMEHEMSTEWNVPHGLGLAIITPVWMRYVYKRNVNLFAKLAVELFGLEYDFDCPERTALAGIDALSEWFQSIGMPRTIREFVDGDTSEATLRRMAARIDYPLEGHKTGFAFAISAEDVVNIYKLAL